MQENPTKVVEKRQRDEGDLEAKLLSKIPISSESCQFVPGFSCADSHYVGKPTYSIDGQTIWKNECVKGVDGRDKTVVHYVLGTALSSRSVSKFGMTRKVVPVALNNVSHRDLAAFQGVPQNARVNGQLEPISFEDQVASLKNSTVFKRSTESVDINKIREFAEASNKYKRELNSLVEGGLERESELIEAATQQRLGVDADTQRIYASERTSMRFPCQQGADGQWQFFCDYNLDASQGSDRVVLQLELPIDPQYPDQFVSSYYVTEKSSKERVPKFPFKIWRRDENGELASDSEVIQDSSELDKLFPLNDPDEIPVRKGVLVLLETKFQQNTHKVGVKVENQVKAVCVAVDKPRASKRAVIDSAC